MSTLAVILAAGQGKRMHQAFPGIPKALVPLGGVPMLLRLVTSVRQSGVTDEIVVVTGPSVEDKIRAALPSDIRLAIQAVPEGTGAAIRAAEDHIAQHDTTLVLYGDHALVRPETISTLVSTHRAAENALTMATVTLPDFSEWRSVFSDWGRVVRDARGTVSRIIEAKDSTGAELRITEVTPSFYCFDSRWLLEHLPKLQNNNAQGEYYATDLVGFAVSEGARTETVPVGDPREAMGVNNPEQLAVAERFLVELATPSLEKRGLGRVTRDVE